MLFTRHESRLSSLSLSTALPYREGGGFQVLTRAVILSLWAAASAFAQLDGVIDLHVHSAPDSGPRSIDALEIARMAQRRGMRALLFKNHYTSTAPLAYLVSQAIPGSRPMVGSSSIARSAASTPAAVEHMAKTTGGGGRVVWMPTFRFRALSPHARAEPGFRCGVAQRRVASRGRQRAVADGRSRPGSGDRAFEPGGIAAADPGRQARPASSASS